jgi:hypothetical protein
MPGEKVKLKLKTAYKDGTTHLLFTYSEFMEKLMALVPPPRSHLVRWSGCFAPNSPIRKQIVKRLDCKKGFQVVELPESGEKKKTHSRYTWSVLLARVFKIDVTACDCGGRLQLLAAVQDTISAGRYLRHVGITDQPPARAPPRYKQGEFNFDESEWERQSESHQSESQCPDGMPVLERD